MDSSADAHTHKANQAYVVKRALSHADSTQTMKHNN